MAKRLHFEWFTCDLTVIMCPAFCMVCQGVFNLSFSFLLSVVHFRFPNSEFGHFIYFVVLHALPMIILASPNSSLQSIIQFMSKNI